MRAILNNYVTTESDDVEGSAGYQYFPASATRLEVLQKAPKTEAVLACPRSVQFDDVVIDSVAMNARRGPMKRGAVLRHIGEWLVSGNEVEVDPGIRDSQFYCPASTLISAASSRQCVVRTARSISAIASSASCGDGLGADWLPAR
jgi:hypothetical protein